MFFTPPKKAHSASSSYNKFESFHVSDLKRKRNQHHQFSKSTEIHQNLGFLPPKKRPYSASLAYNVKKNKMHKVSKFESFLVSDLNTKLNQLCPILKINQYTSKFMFFTPKKLATLSIFSIQ